MPNQRTHATAEHSVTLETAKRQLVEANKTSVGVAMQFLVFVDKIHDMQQRNVVSNEVHLALYEWALDRVYATCGILREVTSEHTVE